MAKLKSKSVKKRKGTKVIGKGKKPSVKRKSSVKISMPVKTHPADKQGYWIGEPAGSSGRKYDGNLAYYNNKKQQ